MGGHNIPTDIIKRRYKRGIHNLLHLYIPIVDYWIVTNNTNDELEQIASGEKFLAQQILLNYLWNQILKLAQ
jgi:predicted ABC-type ATPase